MKLGSDDKTYQRCEVVFLETIAKTMSVVVSRHDVAPDARAALLEDLIFAVAAHLSGSSFSGRVDGREFYSRLVYAVGEDGEYIFGPSSMHEKAAAVARAATK